MATDQNGQKVDLPAPNKGDGNIERLVNWLNKKSQEKKEENRKKAPPRHGH